MLRKLVRLARQVRYRLTAGGMLSARAYLTCAATNGVIRICNRCIRKNRVECPCCGWRGFEFLTIDCGSFTVPTVECPHCHSQERQRMLHVYLHTCDKDFFTKQGRVLHFAPEHHVRALINQNPQLRPVSTDYALEAIAGVDGPKCRNDMQHLGFADNAFTMLFCLHVLEHVPDDRKGIREMYRVLQPGGVAYVMVPFMMGWPKTVEFGKPDPLIFDHVRGYSPLDFKERLAAIDFIEIMPDHFMDKNECRRYRIPTDSQAIYRCVKR